MITRIMLDGQFTYIIERRSPDTEGMVCDALINESSTHIWHLDPVEK